MLLSTSTWAQKQEGRIGGTVVDAGNLEPLVGVAVKIAGNSLGAVTDLDGKFLLKNVPAGTHTLSVSYLGYTSKQIDGVVVKPGSTILVDVNLAESVLLTTDIVIQQTIRKGSVETLILDQQNASAVSSGISAEQIRRTADRTTADVLKRVSGASVQDNKFAIVRGLADRYNMGFLNGTQMPSTEADRKAFSLDVIPSFVIDKVVISKTATPDMPGDFAGGLINITTREIPFENAAFVTVGGGYHSLTTFKQTKLESNPGLDFWGLGAKDRSLPSSLPSSSVYRGLREGNPADTARLFAASRSFNSNLVPTTHTSQMPNISLQAGLNQRLKLFGNDAGLLIAGTLNNQFRNLPTAQNFLEVGSLVRYDTNTNGTYNQLNTTRQLTNLGGLANFSYKIGDYTKITWKNLYTIQAEKSYSELTGRRKADIDDNTFRTWSYIFFYNTNQMLSSQLSAEHVIKKTGTRINATAGLNYFDRSTPDYRRINYLSGFDGIEFGPRRLNAVADVADFNPQYAQRYFSQLYETSRNLNADISHDFNIGNGVKLEAKAGLVHMDRARTFSVRNFNYGAFDGSNSVSLAPDRLLQNTIRPGGLYLKETTTPSDFYEGRSVLNGGFGMVDMRIKELVRFIGGVRYEYFTQSVASTNNSGSPANGLNENADVLPSANVVVTPAKRFQVRLGYSKTVNRPEFREFASVAFYDFNTNIVQIGNSRLQRALIDNYDLKLEWYPAPGQVVSVNPFYKKFVNPIDNVLRPTGSGDPQYQYENLPSAYVRGVELEVRLTGSLLGDEDSFWSNWSVFGNYTLIGSRVDLSQTVTSITSRPLLNQSPNLLNGGLVYQNKDKGWDAGLTVNRIGQRILFSAIRDPKDLIWERPRTVVDLSVAKTLMKDKMTLRWILGDLLAQDLIWYNNLDGNTTYNKGVDVPVAIFRQGFTTNFSINYRF